MEKEFIPLEEAIQLKELGFDEECFAYYNIDTLIINQVKVQHLDYTVRCYLAPLYQQAFRFFREKYEFTYSIGKTNIAVVHYGPTTQLLQNNESYEAAELAAIKWFIDVAKQQIADTSQWISNEVDKMVVEQLIEIAKQQ